MLKVLCGDADPNRHTYRCRMANALSDHYQSSAFLLQLLLWIRILLCISGSPGTCHVATWTLDPPAQPPRWWSPLCQPTFPPRVPSHSLPGNSTLTKLTRARDMLSLNCTFTQNKVKLLLQDRLQAKREVMFCSMVWTLSSAFISGVFSVVLSQAVSEFQVLHWCL